MSVCPSVSASMRSSHFKKVIWYILTMKHMYLFGVTEPLYGIRLLGILHLQQKVSYFENQLHLMHLNTLMHFSTSSR